LGLFTFTSNIQLTKASGTIYIRADGSIDPPTAPIATSDYVHYSFTGDVQSTVSILRSGITIDGAGFTVKGDGGGYGFDCRVNNVTLRNTNVLNFSIGVLFQCSFGTISNNNIRANMWGIKLEWGTHHNTISGNNVSLNKPAIAIWIYGSSNNTISGNRVTENSGSIGIRLDCYSDSNLIYGNNISLNCHGVHVYDHSRHNLILDNNITSNTDIGICIESSSDSNLVCGNQIERNGRGVLVGMYSPNNVFHHNSFVDNTKQVVNYDSINVWDDSYPSGGNYWSDYVGLDFYSGPSQNEIGSDGIGDTPYIINNDNMDRYPLFQDGPSETLVVNLVNGSRAYNWDLELENIALSHPDFRSAGSIGANETANLIKEKFESFGLDAWLEPFQFTNWSLLSKPSLIIDEDGNKDTTHDQNVIGSFQCEHYSWPTLTEGIFADLVILPLPSAANYTESGKYPIDTSTWDTIDTTGKIVLIGREVRWASSWRSTFSDKIFAETPAAIVYTWWYSWMNFTPPMHSSAGGKPLFQCYYWSLGIPSGFVDYWDGLLIRQLEGAQASVSANITIKSVIGNGVHYNVIGKIAGFENPEKLVIISGHYDTVMCSGFCDNGAGTAGVIELARVFAEAVEKNYYRPKYTLLFVCFTGEEMGLVGSANFVKQHKSEMANIVAVINLDGIGSDDLHVSDTPGSDLRQTIMDAAMDLGIAINLETPGGSDQESFRDPSTINDWVLAGWGGRPRHF